MKDLTLNGTFIIYALAYLVAVIFLWGLYIKMKYHTPIE